MFWEDVKNYAREEFPRFGRIRVLHRVDCITKVRKLLKDLDSETRVTLDVVSNSSLQEVTRSPLEILDLVERELLQHRHKYIASHIRMPTSMSHGMMIHRAYAGMSSIFHKVDLDLGTRMRRYADEPERRVAEISYFTEAEGNPLVKFLASAPEIRKLASYSQLLGR